MIISSRTPEGFPSHCVLCGAAANIEFSDPAGDAPCPSCGHLLWFSAETLVQIQRLFAERLGIPAHEVRSHTLVDDLAVDSLDVVELVLEFEDEFGVPVPDDDYEKIRTVGDAVRYIEQFRRKQEP